MTRMTEEQQPHFSSPMKPTAAYSTEQRKKRKTKLEETSHKKKLDSTRSKRRHRSGFKVMVTAEGDEGPEHGRQASR